MAKSTNTTVNVDVDDLKKVYLHVFDAFATDPSTVEEEVEGVNVKYARELLKVLVDAGMVVVSDVNDEADVWQTYPESSDQITHDEAEAKFDAWAESADLHAVTSKPAKSAKKDVGVHPCYCGCGEQVPGTSFYRPGHDARHAGVIGRLVASTGNKDHLNDLPSTKLTEKAAGIAAKVLEKQDAKRKADNEKAEAKRTKAATKADAKPKPEVEHGQVKVGKGRFDAVRHPDGTVEYQSTDGSLKPASASATKSFKPVA